MVWIIRKTAYLDFTDFHETFIRVSEENKNKRKKLDKADLKPWTQGSLLLVTPGNEVEKSSSSNSRKSAKENLRMKLINPLNPNTDQHKFPPYNIKTYCMAKIVRSLWLAAKWALCSCNDHSFLARCPRHIQSVFNLIMGILINIHVMVDWQQLKRVFVDQCQMTVSWDQVLRTLRWRVFQSYLLTSSWF